MLNCIPHRGALRPILPPKRVKSFSKDAAVLAIHRVSDREHYLIYDGNKLTWEDVKDYSITGELYDFKNDGGVISVTPIGNTLAVLDGNGIIHYFLWKNDGYTNLGTQLPELEAKPYIKTHIFDNNELDNIYGTELDQSIVDVELSGTNLINTSEAQKLYSGAEHKINLYGDTRQNVYNKVFAKLNAVKRLLQKNGFLTSPFYIRFAYRLYDNTHAQHTIPVLLVPTTWGTPVTGAKISSEGKVTFNPLFSGSEILAEIKLPENISDWGDLISHIDVFITPQIENYTDDANAVISLSQLPYWNREKVVNESGQEIEKWAYGGSDEPELMDGEQWMPISQAVSSTDSDYNYKLYKTLSVKKDASFVAEANTYYAVDISNAQVKLTQKEWEAFVPYYYDIDPLSPEEVEKINLPLPEEGSYNVYSFAKNKTVHIKGGDAFIRQYTKKTKSEFEDIHHYIELKRVDGKKYKDLITDYSNFYRICELPISDYKTGISGVLPLKENALIDITTSVTLSELTQRQSKDIVSQTFAYNNRLNAIIKGESLPDCPDIEKQNPTSETESNWKLIATYVKVNENSQVTYHLLSNPDSYIDTKFIYFAYPRATATELILIWEYDGHYSTETIKLTRHPFLNLAYVFNMFDDIRGEQTMVDKIPNYPQTPILYGNKIKTSNVNNPFIFSEENTSELPVGKIHALSTAAKALSQGQFGQFPLYAFTDKGIWALEVTGTGTYSARQVITRDVALTPESVTQIDDAVLFSTDRGIMLLAGSQVQCITEALDGTTFDITQLKFAYDKISKDHKDFNIVSWDTYKANIQMLYDYTGQRIIVFNPDYGYSYVFSLDSKQWGITVNSIQSTIDYYPQAYAMTSDGTLVDYSATDDTEAKGHYITRPIKLGAPDVHKTITSIIQRGQFKKGHVNTMLYGSRDLETWHPVYGSTDHILRGMRGTPYKYFRLASTFTLGKDESITGCSIDFEPRLNNKLR